MATREDAQAGAWDRVIENLVVETQISMMLELKAAQAETVAELAREHRLEPKDVKAAKRAVMDFIGTIGLQDGERLRIGRFVMTGKARAGGGIEVPAWEKVVVGKIEALD